MRFLTPAFVTVGMLAVVGVLVGGYFVKGLFAKPEAAPAVQRKNIPMALSDLEPGTIITAAHIGLGPINPEELQKSRDIMMSDTKLIGRVVKEKITAVTPIHTAQLYQPGDGPSLEVEPGMRAVSLSVSDSTALVSGQLKPKQYVDVHLTPQLSDERVGGGMTLTLFKGVKVLSVSRGGRTGDRSGNQVTLEVTPRQVNVVTIAKGRGDLTLSYNPAGKGDGGVLAGTEDRATFDEILGLKAPTPPTPPTLTENYKGVGRAVTAFIDGKRPDMNTSTSTGRGYGYGGGYGGYGGYGNSNWWGWGNYGLRPAPMVFWNMSHPTSGGDNSSSNAQPQSDAPVNGPSASTQPIVNPFLGSVSASMSRL